MKANVNGNWQIYSLGWYLNCALCLLKASVACLGIYNTLQIVDMSYMQDNSMLDNASDGA
jgi:hypothetical protein